MSTFRKFFSTVRGSIKGMINHEELYRAILTALGSGSVVAVLLSILQSVVAHVATIFPNPTTSTLATMLLTLVIDLLRRQSQGTAPAKPVDPAASPA